MPMLFTMSFLTQGINLCQPTTPGRGLVKCLLLVFLPRHGVDETEVFDDNLAGHVVGIRQNRNRIILHQCHGKTMTVADDGEVAVGGKGHAAAQKVFLWGREFRDVAGNYPLYEPRCLIAIV